jgi:hypothetical protein
MTAKTRGRKRTAVERWNDAVRIAHEHDDASDRTEEERVPGPEAVLALSEEELDRQLREAGVDLDALHAQADAACEVYKAHVAKVDPAPPSEAPETWVMSSRSPSMRAVRPTRRSRAPLIACVAAAAAGAVGVASYLAAHNPPEKDVTPKPDAGAPPVPEAPKTVEPKPVAPPPTAPEAPSPDDKKKRP